MADQIEFTVKNPVQVTPSPYKLRAKLTSTVQDLKETIQQEYDGHPDSQVQTVRHCFPSEHISQVQGQLNNDLLLQLIYAGKVLRENSLLVKDFIHQVCQH